MAEVAARPEAVEPVEEPTVGHPDRPRGTLPNGVPAHRVQLARALADAVVGAIEVGDAEGAKVAVGMLGEFVGRVVDQK